MLKLIVGLGNPGPEYRNTRHNFGFLFVDRLEREGVLPSVRCLKPSTYMNRSGEEVAAWVRRHRVPRGSILLVYDEISLPLGRIRLRLSGSSGGHLGMRSVIESLGSQDIPRLRLGVGPVPEGQDAAEFVLSPFSRKEMAVVEEVLEKSLEAVRTAVQEGFEKAMSLYNL